MHRCEPGLAWVHALDPAKSLSADRASGITEDPHDRPHASDTSKSTRRSGPGERRATAIRCGRCCRSSCQPKDDFACEQASQSDGLVPHDFRSTFHASMSANFPASRQSGTWCPLLRLAWRHPPTPPQHVSTALPVRRTYPVGYQFSFSAFLRSSSRVS